MGGPASTEVDDRGANTGVASGAAVGGLPSPRDMDMRGFTSGVELADERAFGLTVTEGRVTAGEGGTLLDDWVLMRGRDVLKLVNVLLLVLLLFVVAVAVVVTLSLCLLCCCSALIGDAFPLADACDWPGTGPPNKRDADSVVESRGRRND